MYTMQDKEPYIEVGIVHRKELEFSLNGDFWLNGISMVAPGTYIIRSEGGKVCFCEKIYDELSFVPTVSDISFDISQVLIGIRFHWEREESQRFPGELKIICDESGLVAINRVPLETYLISVISSEMKASASAALLRAHAVISRSWLLAQLSEKGNKSTVERCVENGEEIIKWFDREEHVLYDVCADDHCQRYQGITKAFLPEVAEAVRETRGEVVVYDGKVCDARFSKCCGGVSERFESCWDNAPHDYLTPVYDREDDRIMPDFSSEEAANIFIRRVPDVFCNTRDEAVLDQVLNDYDRETNDFFRWTIKFRQADLSRLLQKKLGIDFGKICDLIPLSRGASGRIIRLKIVGTKRTVVIGKELLIRRALSETHLYSSAFVVDKSGSGKGIPEEFVLIGAGWGHGVGLCQIGAAVMGEKGYSYRQILEHYFKNTELRHIYP